MSRRARDDMRPGHEHALRYGQQATAGAAGRPCVDASDDQLKKLLSMLLTPFKRIVEPSFRWISVSLAVGCVACATA